MDRVHVQQTAMVLARSRHVQVVHGERNRIVQTVIRARIPQPVDRV